LSGARSRLESKPNVRIGLCRRVGAGRKNRTERKWDAVHRVGEALMGVQRETANRSGAPHARDRTQIKEKGRDE